VKILATRIRLKRMGAKKAPFYRVVVADSRYPRDGRFIEEIGYYDPTKKEPVIEIKEDRALSWLATGAEPSATVKSLFKKKGIIKKYAESKQNAE
jgi:small subunit ribosomal protein S16